MDEIIKIPDKAKVLHPGLVDGDENVTHICWDSETTLSDINLLRDFRYIQR